MTIPFGWSWLGNSSSADVSTVPAMRSAEVIDGRFSCCYDAYHSVASAPGYASLIIMVSSVHDRPAWHRLLALIFIWILLSASSWPVALDHADLATWPCAELEQALESDLDEITDPYFPTCPIGESPRGMSAAVLITGVNVGGRDLASERLSSSLPLYSLFSNYRI